MNRITRLIMTLAVVCLIMACENDSSVPLAEASFGGIIEASSPHKDFEEYWYNGTAEVSSYELEQFRYGEKRSGDAVLVFVSEPFSKKKQVKLDIPGKVGGDHVPVLKLNHIRKFNTGIYDYSIMTSSFTPVDLKTHPYTIKSTTSSQEWCGHTFTQLNLDGRKYRLQEFSYFESEGDSDYKIQAAMLEDDIMTRIRIEGELPIGEMELVPSTIYSRFAHVQMKPFRARIIKSKTDDIVSYDIRYIDIDRLLRIDVQSEFPHKILSWSEENDSGNTTTATLKKTLNTPYWSKNNIIDENLRMELGLTK